MNIDWNKVKDGLTTMDVLKEENKELKEENEKLHSIIKEVREIFKYYGDRGDIIGYSNYFITGEALLKLLEILDKENI